MDKLFDRGSRVAEELLEITTEAEYDAVLHVDFRDCLAGRAVWLWVIASAVAGIAKILFFIFLVLFLISLITTRRAV